MANVTTKSNKKPSPPQAASKPEQPPAADSNQQAALRLLTAQKLNVAFANIVTLMMRHQAFRTHFIAELEWILVPAVATGQFLISEVKESAEGIPIPVAAVLWARVSEEVDKRLQGLKQRPKLAPNEWASGSIPWLVDAIGEPREAANLVKHLSENVFAKTGLRAVERAADGSAVVRVLGKAPAN